MCKYNIAICDDDKEIVNNIIHMVKDVDIAYTLCGFSHPSEVFSYINSHGATSLQIVIMDVEFDDCNGIEESNHLLSKYPNLKIILLTGHVEYVHNILETNPVSFIFKPVVREELERALNRAITSLNTLPSRKAITLRIKRNYHNVFLDEIVYIESHLRNATIHFEHYSENCMRKLNDIEKLLDDSFIRCHQSYIINMRYISRLENNKIILFNGVIIPISRNRKSQVYDSFLQFYGDIII